MRKTVASAGLILLLGLGALGWAKGRDPFTRAWFTLTVPGQGRTQCVAVWPKTAPPPYPVVVYLHGAGSRVLRDGNDLRAMAEMGLATVGMDYCQTNDGVFEQQFAALLQHLERQSWADTNAMAWVGYSLGAEQVTRFALRHPEAHPGLLVRLGGGGLPEFERLGQPDGSTASSVVRASVAGASTQGKAVLPRTLLVHGDQDVVFPIADAERVATALRANGVPVALQALRGVGHSLEPVRGGVFRAIGEYALAGLRGVEALAEYRSVATWQAERWPLWGWWLPAVAWLGGGWFVHRRRRRNAAPADLAVSATATVETWAARRASVLPRRRPPKSVGWKCSLPMLAALLALLALSLTAVHLGLPRLRVSERTLAVARQFLVPAAAREDFDYLAGLPCWGGQQLRPLLEHVGLAHYNRGLVNWQLADAIYREFVLSPVLGSTPQRELNWRRALWESLYPRIRNEASIGSAAQVVVQHLRERVTVVTGTTLPAEVASVWQRQLTGTTGFERLLVAALRSVGIAARLDEQGQAELFTDGKWQPAPRPVVRVRSSHLTFETYTSP